MIRNHRWWLTGWWLMAATLALAPGLAASPGVQGTSPLAGADAQLGKTYTLYMGTPQALNFTLNKVEYHAGHFITDPGTSAERDYLREAGKKLVVLHYSVHNPQKTKVFLRGDSLNMVGVDSNNKDIRRVYGSGAYDEITRKSVNADLQPAQKMNLMMALELDSRASLPKLMVETNKATKAVWRYALAGKITGLSDPFRDPRVADGSAALDTQIPGQFNLYLPGKEVDFKVTGLSYSTGELLDRKVPAGGKVLLVNLNFRNPHFRPYRLGNGFPPVRAKVFDQDDLAGGEVGKLYFASRDQQLEGELAMNKDIGARLAVALPAGLIPQRIEFTDTNKRSFSFDLTALK